MPYTTPPVGTILPAKENTGVSNPGPVHDPYGLDEWLQAQAQHTAWENNKDLVEDWQNAVENNPPDSPYAMSLGSAPSWAVVVIAAEAGGVTFDQQRVGPAVNTLS